MAEGILVMDKPDGFTSFDVVAKLRGIYNTKKIGHGGTLDPMATGVLPVFIGNAAKAVDLQTRQDKTYEAGILFGIKTDTGDVTGSVICEATAAVTPEMVEAVLPRFLGLQSQLPPMYSAVKINGKALYKYAREGVQIKRKPREITVHSAACLSEMPLYSPSENQSCVSVRFHCSKGTYIRVLAEDIGEALGVPATLCQLRRTNAGVFGLENAYTFAQVQKAKDEGNLEKLLLGVETVFEDMPRVNLTHMQTKQICNGIKLRDVKADVGRYKVYSDDVFIGLAEMFSNGEFKNEKMFLQLR